MSTKNLTAIGDNLAVRLQARAAMGEDVTQALADEAGKAILAAWQLGVRDGFDVAARAVRGSSSPQAVADALEAARLSLVGS